MPLFVHEWGVQVFGRDGSRMPAALPSYFHRSAGPHHARSAPVRGLPPDSGTRALPVVHFYSPGTAESIPVALEVGFTQGAASHWFPQVDRHTPAATANGASARADRARLVASRNGQNAYGPRSLLPSDPTRQLEWSELALTRQPRRAAPTQNTPWVDALRNFQDALWVDNGSETERFVFYEADTTERPALSIEVGPRYSAHRRHFVLRNPTDYPVHNVFVVHRESGAIYVFAAPSIPAHASAGFILEDHRVRARDLRTATRERLADQLRDAAEPAPPTDYRWDTSQCVMDRDPAIPVETAQGHRLYSHEVDALLDVWNASFFEQQGTTIVYREDVRYLDETMPLSVYSDMFHFPVVRRTGLAVWNDVALPHP